jgi:serine/threonine-protein kinase HipA
LALPIGGKKANLTRRSWLDFAKYCEIPQKAAERLLADQIDATQPAIELIESCFLAEELKKQFKEIVKQSTATLAG